ncbi:hypothetical protein [Chryseobacterium sp. SIMBA_038]|uniref:hypothetical protein n=1 Tax=Chryseobacterium sp. SIMBA_038 TaxID=3085780 RepID=UPI00397AD938
MIPETEVELEKWMIENCHNFGEYSINGNHIWEGFGIEKNGNFYHWYFTERGKREILEIFKTEKEIVEYAYKHISSNKWSTSHCIGFLFNEDESKELKNILQEMRIEYYQDKIPYSSGEKQTAYRTFVFGCDIKKVNDLKGNYFKIS